MKKSTVAVALPVCLLNVVPLAAQFPTRPPPPTELRAMQLPPFDEATLPNGLQIVVVENHRLPLVSISLTMLGGASHDPAGKEGLASLTSDLLLRGTTTRSADDIAAEIESVGARLNTGAGSDFFTLSTTVLKEHLDLAFDLIGDVLLRTTFPEEEVDLTRTRTLSGLRAQEAQPAFLAAKYFDAAVYGEHPYGRTATSTSVGSITREDVVGYAADRLRPGGAVLVVSGDISMAEARDMAGRYFEGWSGTAAENRSVNVPDAKPTGILLVNRPGSAQSNILVGNLTMRPGDADYYATVVANKIFGGGADSRLFLILREQNGWTYGAYSNHSRPEGVGRFQASTEARAEVTDSALAEILHQMRRLRTELVPAEELAGAKGFLVGSFPLSIQTPQQIAGRVRTVRLLGLGDDYLRTYRERLAAVDADGVMSVARRRVRPDSAVIVVVGDGAKIYDGLSAIASVRIIDAGGNPMTPSDLLATPESIVFDPSQLVVGRDSFAIIVQGNLFGALTRTIERSMQDDRPVFLVKSEIQMGAMGGQSAEYVLDAASLDPITYEQSANQMGRTVQVQLTYGEGGRVTGSVSGADEASIDTVFGTPVYDLDMLSTIVPTMALADGASFTLAIFQPTTQTFSQETVSVTDGGMVTVPAGEFDTWQVNVSGQLAWIFMVSKADPRRVVKMEIAGQPLSFELAATEGR